MPHYVDIAKFEGSWNDRGRGRRVQCPRCGEGVRMYVRPTAGACSRCRVPVQVLTADPDQATRLSGENATADRDGSSSTA